MKIKVLGSGCMNCKTLESRTREAAKKYVCISYAGGVIAKLFLIETFNPS